MSTDLAGQEIGGEWTVSHKAPAQARVRFWTVAHKCGTAVDLAQTLLQQAIKGRSSLPPCTACTPAASLPDISHGMHLTCGAPHLIGDKCGDGVQREPNGAAPPAFTVERIPATATSSGGSIMRPDPYEPVVLVQNGKPLTGDALNLVGAHVHGRDTAAAKAARTALAAQVQVVDLDALPDEPAYLVGECGPETVTLPPLPALVEPEPVSLDVEHGQHIPHATAPSVVVAGPCDRLDAPQDVLEVIKAAMNGYSTPVPGGLTPTSPGASALGTECERKLGHRLAFGKSPFEPSWPAQVGTAVHTWLEDVFTKDGRTLPDGSPRWRSGYWITDPITCPIDLFDVLDGRMIDFKVVGKTTLDKARRGKVAEKYTTQAHLYGLGMQRDGYDVRTVALLFLPSSGKLADAAWWEADYDPAVAWAALARRDKIRAMLDAVRSIGVEDAEARVLALLDIAEDYCGSCPARGTYCPGATPAPAPALTLARA